jgi:short-subunit dehydrogenase
MKHYKDKVVVITGAGAGMGEALTRLLLKYDATVIATDISIDRLTQLIESIDSDKGHIAIEQLDVTNKKAFEKLLKKVKKEYGSLDFLFNNAGIAIAGEVRDLSWGDWQKTIDVDQMGVLNGTLAAYEIMLEQESGHIVNTASIAGIIPSPLLVPYSMTKHAVLGMSLGLREEAKQLGVKVSAVCPGVVKTSIADGDFVRGADVPNVFEESNFALRANMASADVAAKIILKGVAKNQAKIIFPLHGKTLVRSFLSTPKAFSLMTQGMLKGYRKELRR